MGADSPGHFRTKDERLAAVEAAHEALEKQVNDCVTLDRFRPVERIVYGVVGLVLIAVASLALGALFRTDKLNAGVTEGTSPVDLTGNEDQR